ncbi:MAG: DNA-binding response regulator, partial [Chloroflexi bacterium]
MTQRILIVEDECDIVNVVKGYLEQAGYQTMTAYDGKTGLFMARQERPDLVVLDIMLPEMDGLEVLRRLRQESEVYVLMLTA